LPTGRAAARRAAGSACSLAIILAALALAGCLPRLAEVPGSGPVVLPGDHRAHNAPMEWWYTTGHLTTASGRELAYELVFFKAHVPEYAGLLRNVFWSPGLAAHFAITDLDRGGFDYAERATVLSTRPGRVSYETLDVAIGPNTLSRERSEGEWRIWLEGDVFRVQAAARHGEVDLTLRPLKPAALHGQGGVIEMGGSGRSYYYSMTRLEVRGAVASGGPPEPARGAGWLDHQWGDFWVPRWDWFSLQLDDGRDLMVFAFPRVPCLPPLDSSDCDLHPSSTATLVGPAGEGRVLRPQEWSYRPVTTWTSPRSGATYPQDWELNLESEGLALHVSVSVPQTELITDSSTRVTYWEGPVVASGNSRGRPVTGRGFVELNGYAAHGWAAGP
jgi:predicted secreted hydrolase